MTETEFYANHSDDAELLEMHENGDHVFCDHGYADRDH